MIKETAALLKAIIKAAESIVTDCLGSSQEENELKDMLLGGTDRGVLYLPARIPFHQATVSAAVLLTEINTDAIDLSDLMQTALIARIAKEGLVLELIRTGTHGDLF